MAWRNSMWRWLRSTHDSDLDALEGLGQKVVHLPAYLQSIIPQDRRHDVHQHGVQEEVTSALQPVVQCCPWQEVCDLLHGRPCGSATQHPSLSLSASEGSQWLDKSPLWLTAWPSLLDFRKETRSVCTTWPKAEKSRQNSSHHGNTHTRWSLRSTTWSASYNNMLGRRC